VRTKSLRVRIVVVETDPSSSPRRCLCIALAHSLFAHFIRRARYLVVGGYRRPVLNGNRAHKESNLLAPSVGERQCIDFSVPVHANFLTTLRSHMDITCSCYF